MENNKNLFHRVVSSFVIFIISFLALYCGNMTFYLLILSLTVISSFEWNNITNGRKSMYCFAIMIIVLPYSSLIYIYQMPHGITILIWLVLSVWSVDIAAYFVGKNLGGCKIIPIISPNKTWSGLLGGIFAAIITGIIMSIIFGIFAISDSIVVGVVIAIVAQIGDLTESAIKRLCKTKDSGNIIPGHGGILDRMDGFIFTAPLVAYYIKSVSRFFE